MITSSAVKPGYRHIPVNYILAINQRAIHSSSGPYNIKTYSSAVAGSVNDWDHTFKIFNRYQTFLLKMDKTSLKWCVHKISWIFNFCCTDFIQGNIRHTFIFYQLSMWDARGNENLSLWKILAHLSCCRYYGCWQLKIDALMQQKHNSIANALEIRIICFKPTINQ